MIPGNTARADDFTGFLWPTIRRTAPASLGALGWLFCDGSAVSRSTYSALFAYLCPSSTVTMTIASPGVITWTAHPLVNGDIVKLTTTGALPTGFTAGTKYYVVNSATNTFQLAATRGGIAINTSGSQSGTHTARCVSIGDGDGSTTFNVPDMRGRAFIGAGTGSKVIILPAVAISSNQIATNGGSDFSQGQAVLYNGSSITGLSDSTTYYVIYVDSTHIKLASSLVNAHAGTAISISGTPSTDTLTVTLTSRVPGDTGGEEDHGLSISELPAHHHGGVWTRPGSGSLTETGGASQSNQNTGDTGGDLRHNNMMPFFAGYWWIHI